MYFKKWVILFVFLVAIPIVNSNFDFQCDDGTLLGECNLNGEVCAIGNNLVDEGVVTLNPDREYLFFGFIENGCYLDLYDLHIGDKIIPLSLSGRSRVVAEFTAGSFFGGLVDVKCRVPYFSGSVNLISKYLGEISTIPNLYKDCEFCGACIEESFIDSNQNNLIINVGPRGHWLFLKEESEANLEGIKIIVNKMSGDISARTVDLTISGNFYNDLKVGDEIDLGTAKIKVDSFSPSEVFIVVEFKLPLVNIFDSLGVGYDLYDHLSARNTYREYHEELPILSDLYNYSNIFWIPSYRDIKSSEVLKFKKYIEHGGNLFVFLEDILPPLPSHQINREELKFLFESVSFDERKMEVYRINIPEGGVLSNGLSDINFEKPLGVTSFTHFYIHFDNLNPVLTMDDRILLSIKDNGHSPFVLISSLNFYNSIPSNFSKQLFRNLFDLIQAEDENCTNGVDDNKNGVIDCNDIGCFESKECKSCIGEGIFNNECSSTNPPLICIDSEIVPNCQTCGCRGLYCLENGECGRERLEPIYKEFFNEEIYLISRFSHDVLIDFEVFEPDGFNLKRDGKIEGFVTLKDNENNERKIDIIICNQDYGSVVNSYECFFMIEKESITETGKYSFQVSLTNSNNVTGVSEWKNFEVVDLPSCININEDLGIVPVENAVRVAFYADNYDDFEVFRGEAVDILDIMFESYPETYGRYKNRFDFYISEYVKKNSCNVVNSRLYCDDTYRELFNSKICGEDTSVQFSDRNFRSNSAIQLSVKDPRKEYVLAHELGHNPLGLGDAYCEWKRYTTPDIYPNTFGTLEECEEYSNTHLGGRECEPICDWDEGVNEEQGGFVMEHEGEVMMASGGDFSLPSQMRVNWFFDCCTPSSCSDLPKYCSTNICGICPSNGGYKGDTYRLPPCADVICNQKIEVEHPTERDLDEDGSVEALDCRDNDYATHPGYPPVSFLDIGNRLSESCDAVDYNCDNTFQEQCSYTPKCPDLHRRRCINEHDFVFEKSETFESCCGGCSGEIGEWMIEEGPYSCGEDFCIEKTIEKDGDTNIVINCVGPEIITKDEELMLKRRF